MSARDDYPLHRALEMLNGGPSALDEIDRLRAENEALILDCNTAHDATHGLDASTIEYALRCAAGWLEERGNASYMDLDDERGRILRWDRDHPEPEFDVDGDGQG